MPLEFVVNGRVVSADALRASTPPAKRVTKDRQVAFLGWRVHGRPPGAVEQAEKDAAAAAKRWLGLSQGERAQAARRGEKPPKPWDLDAWLVKTKPKAVRSKPYEIRDAADQCAELARRAGWTHVEIVSVEREAS